MKQTCILTCHGFTGYPEEMRLLGEYFQGKGFIWKNLHLPGHGTTPEELRNTTWKDWATYVLNEVDQVLTTYDNNVFLIGFSLGGLLTLYVLEHRPKLLGGIILATPVNVANFFQRNFIKIRFLNFWIKGDSSKIDIYDQEMKKNHQSYPKFHSSNARNILKLIKEVKRDLKIITQPILIAHSKKDQIVDWNNASYIYKSIKSEKKELVFYHKSSHVLTKDFDRHDVFSKCFEFIRSILNYQN